MGWNWNMTADRVSRIKRWAALVLLTVGLQWNLVLGDAPWHHAARQGACFTVFIGLLILVSWYRGRRRIRENHFFVSYLQKQHWDN